MRKILIFSLCMVFSALIQAQNSPEDSYKGLSKLAGKSQAWFFTGFFSFTRISQTQII